MGRRGDPIADQWFSAGWNPSPEGTGWSGTGLRNWAFGTAHSTVQAGNGWQESRHALHTAVRVPLDQGWTASAGLGIGARTWILNGQSWSWDAQYGPGGYDPTAPSGEPDGLVSGAGVAPELALGIAAGRRPRQGPALQGAISLHHVLPVAAPTFQPMAGDTASHTVSLGSNQNDLGVKRILWTAWWRGASKDRATSSNSAPPSDGPSATRPCTPKHPRPPTYRKCGGRMADSASPSAGNTASPGLDEAGV